MDLDDFDRIASEFSGVRCRRGRDGLRWTYEGRLVARQLDDTSVVIRAAFDVRDVLLHQFPDTFSFPARFARHMMIVADLAHGSPDAIEDAVASAWRLQAGAEGER